MMGVAPSARRVRGFASLVVVGVLAACGDSSAQGGAGSGGQGGAGVSPSCLFEALPEDTAAPPPIATPRWVYRPWISKDISTGEDSRDFVQGFFDNDIPVGTLVIDSPWETSYNTFTPNPSRYPDFAQMVADFRAQDVRVVLWTTQMINTGSYDLEPGGDFYEGPSPDWEPANACGLFVNDGAINPWWKGQGSAIDFFDPAARVFWHRMQDRVLDAGIAGFKLDFGENYIVTQPLATADGEKTLQEYSEAYYRDFYAYGSARMPPGEFVTMVRPYDKSYQFDGRFFARPEHAPVTWVGDNRRDYVGMADALDHTFKSALAGYVVIGGDLGGYLDRDDKDLTLMVPLDADVFMRWTALAAMEPFMQLHGRANLTPWTFPDKTDEVLATYRFWAKLHDALVPFFDSVAQRAYADLAGGQSAAVPMIAPLSADEADWPGDFRYLLGGAFLVAPVLDATGARDVALPAGDTWFDLFDPAATALPGGGTLALDVSDPTRIPVFVREGAIVPLEVVDDTNGLGTAASAGALTLLVYPAAGGSSFDVIGADGALEVGVDATKGAGSATVDVTAHPRPLLLRVRAEAAPASVDVAGAALPDVGTRAAFDAASEGWFVDGAFVWVKLAPGTDGAVVVN